MNILTDRRAIHAVCEWSDFPTMPQIFVHGGSSAGRTSSWVLQDGSLREMFVKAVKPECSIFNHNLSFWRLIEMHGIPPLPMQSESRRRLVVEGGERIIDFNHKAFKPIPEEGIAMATDAMRRGVCTATSHRPRLLTARFEKTFASTWA